VQLSANDKKSADKPCIVCGDPSQIIMDATNNTTERNMNTPTLKITFEMTWNRAAVAATAAGAGPESDCHTQAIHDVIKASRHSIYVIGAGQYKMLADMDANGYRVAKIEAAN
jgi:hypothetical protein